MSLQKLLHDQNLSVYRLSQLTGIPYSTLNDLKNDKKKVEDCSVKIVVRLADIFHMTTDEIIFYLDTQRPSFGNFRSDICHKVRSYGDMPFVEWIESKDTIRLYYKKGWKEEAFYLLAMTDYLRRIHNLSTNPKYDALRKEKLPSPVYPTGLKLLAIAKNNPQILKNAKYDAIPEFIRFNIVENDIRNSI